MLLWNRYLCRLLGLTIAVATVGLASAMAHEYEIDPPGDRHAHDYDTAQPGLARSTVPTHTGHLIGAGVLVVVFIGLMMNDRVQKRRDAARRRD